MEPGLPQRRRSVDGAVPVLYLGSDGSPFGGFQVLDAAARVQLVVALLGVDKGHLVGVLQRLALNQFPPVGYPSQQPAGEEINRSWTKTTVAALPSKALPPIDIWGGEATSLPLAVAVGSTTLG